MKKPTQANALSKIISVYIDFQNAAHALILLTQRQETDHHSSKTLCKNNSCTNQLMSIRCFRWTCEEREYAVLGKSGFPALLWANVPFIYPPEQITNSARFSRVCSGIYLLLSPEPGHIIHDSVIQRAWSAVQAQSPNCHIPCYNYPVIWDRA